MPGRLRSISATLASALVEPPITATLGSRLLRSKSAARSSPPSASSFVGLHQPALGELVQRRARDLLPDQLIERLIAPGRDDDIVRTTLELGAVRQPPQPRRPSALRAAARVDHLMPGRDVAAIGGEDRAEPVAGDAEQRPGIDQRHAERADEFGDLLGRRMIDQRGDFGIGVVLDRAKEGFGGRIRR